MPTKTTATFLCVLGLGLSESVGSGPVRECWSMRERGGERVIKNCKRMNILLNKCVE